MIQNRQWLIDGNPAGRAVRESDFRKVETKLPRLRTDHIRVKVEYLEFTPSLKGQMENRLSYASKTKAGQVMRGRGYGTVIESQSEHIAIGEKVHGYLGWQEIATLHYQDVKTVPDDRFLRHHLGPLGSTGMAAYFGFFDAGKPNAGDVVLISGAAGAVGSMVGQMAKIKGCKVIGVTGGKKKCAHLIEGLGLNAAINYRSENLYEAIKTHAPDGVNVVFDNVGGAFLDAALGNLAIGARVVICGAISRYETDTPPPGPTNYFNLVHKRATMQGILSPDYKDRFPEAVDLIRGWLKADQFKYFEDIQHGFDNIPKTFLRLFSGANIGKQLIRL
jgi:NADPH-dependent curcumin reductase CurA